MTKEEIILIDKKNEKDVDTKNNMIALDVLYEFLDKENIEAKKELNSPLENLLYNYFEFKGTSYEESFKKVLEKNNINYCFTIHNAIYHLLSNSNSFSNFIKSTDFPGINNITNHNSKYTLDTKLGKIDVFKADEIFKDHKSYYIFLKELKNCCYARTYDFLKENQDDYKAVLAYIPHIFYKGHYHVYLEKYDGKILDIAGNSLYDSVEEANTILKPDIIKKYSFEEIQKEYDENKDLFKNTQNKYYKLQTLTLMKDKIR